jgi:flagellar protein FlbD
MITLTRLNGTRICLNTFLIEHLEETPDTIVTLTNGHRFLVQESIDAIVEASMGYLARLHDVGIEPSTAGQIGRVG